MKKLTIAAALLLSMSFVACKKNYVCECSKTRTSGGTSLTTVDADYTFNDTKTGAISKCNAKETSGSDAYGAYTLNCDIK